MTTSGSILRGHWRELTFGFSATLLSGFGQTYFVSLFLISLVSAHGISQGRFGVIYSIATLAAGLLLPRFGRWLDTRSDRLAFLAAGAGMAVSLLILSSASTWWVLLAALFGLRMCGPGAMSLISATSMARHFERRRGVALGVSSLGYPCAEMVLPATTLVLVALLGWRQSVVLYAGVLVAALALIHFALLAHPLKSEFSPRRETDRRLPSRGKFRWWRDPLFLLVNATSLVLPLGGTIIMLYLVPISQDKGWPGDWIGAGFAAFAVVRAAVSILIGPLIDHFGGLRLFPWSFLPFCLATAVLWLAASPWVGLLFFVLMGLGFGAGPLLTALLTEVYGHQRIGEIRSLSTSAVILSTALGPFVVGLAIDYGSSFDSILVALFILSLLAFAGALAVPTLGRRTASAVTASILPAKNL